MRRSPNPSALRGIFLATLAQHGNVTLSAASVNICRATAYAWRAADPEFAAAWEEALSLGLCGLEDKAMELAMDGNEKLIMFLLSSRMPERYGQRATLELNAHVSLGLNRVPLDVLRAELATLLGSRSPSDAAALFGPLESE